jgi:hypothetical protein
VALQRSPERGGSGPLTLVGARSWAIRSLRRDTLAGAAALRRASFVTVCACSVTWASASSLPFRVAPVFMAINVLANIVPAQ